MAGLKTVCFYDICYVISLVDITEIQFLCVVASSGYYEEFFTRLDIVLMVEIIPH
jgi:hypothetical protein